MRTIWHGKAILALVAVVLAVGFGLNRVVGGEAGFLIGMVAGVAIVVIWPFKLYTFE